MPEDDAACGTIDCDGLNTMCLEYQDLTTNRCALARRVQGDEHGEELRRLHDVAPPAARAGGGAR